VRRNLVGRISPGALLETARRVATLPPATS
jgi:hypothetical protein